MFRLLRFFESITIPIICLLLICIAVSLVVITDCKSDVYSDCLRFTPSEDCIYNAKRMCNP